MTFSLMALLGGVLIGLASWLLLLALGKIAGISGITAGILLKSTADKPWRIAFVLGLIMGGAAAISTMHISVTPTTHQPLGLVVMAGLLVGFGTVLGSGCTSGHGICGLGRRSIRSLVSVVVFIGMGMLTTTLLTLIRGV